MVLVILAALLTMALVTAQKIKEHLMQESYNRDFEEIQSQFDKIYAQVGKPIGQIDGNWCTACSFLDTQTEQSQAGALDVNNQAWSSLWFSGAPLDPYGNPYTIDENEKEFGANDCRPDEVISAGPDGIFFTNDDVDYQIHNPYCQHSQN